MSFSQSTVGTQICYLWGCHFRHGVDTHTEACGSLLYEYFTRPDARSGVERSSILGYLHSEKFWFQIQMDRLLFSLII